jgi:hypothetical protein
MEAKFEKLLREYSRLQDEMMEYTMDYFDSMSYDISGYRSDYFDDNFDEIESLRRQVNGFKLILKGLKMVDYTYG